jgi:hypothetical protein
MKPDEIPYGTKIKLATRNYKGLNQRNAEYMARLQTIYLIVELYKWFSLNLPEYVISIDNSFKEKLGKYKLLKDIVLSNRSSGSIYSTQTSISEKEINRISKKAAHLIKDGCSFNIYPFDLKTIRIQFWFSLMIIDVVTSCNVEIRRPYHDPINYYINFEPFMQDELDIEKLMQSYSNQIHSIMKQMIQEMLLEFKD